MPGKGMYTFDFFLLKLYKFAKLSNHLKYIFNYRTVFFNAILTNTFEILNANGQILA